MYEFIKYVLYELKNSFVLVVLAGIAGLGILGAAYGIHWKKYKGQRKFPWGRAVLWLMLAGYAAIVLYATLLRGTGGFRSWNLHLFRAWREAWNDFSAKNWANVLLNVAMFAPLGFLLPLLGRKFRKWYVTIPTGFGVSLAIELIQLAVCIGICDVDDLFANTLGAGIGYFLVMTFLSLGAEKGKRLKPAFVYGGLTCAVVFSICGIFLAYDVQEYGNLPGAAAYTTDTGDVTWTLACTLPEEDGKAAVYQNQTRTLADCDVFAAEFAQTIGTEFDDISYYQEAAYYMNHGGEDGWHHFLHVSYYDGSFEYSCGNLDNREYVDTDRETLEAVLVRYPVTIPDYAEFTVEGDGWHSFTVEQHVDGAVMIDGTLRCRYAADGTIREIENDLLSYTYYDQVDIIAPEEAYAKLCAGKFSGYGFEYYTPEEVTVLSCTLAYEIDTKGFYQPVYHFEIASADGTYQARIMIPAMK